MGIDDNGEIQYLDAKLIQDNGSSNNENILSYAAGGFPNCYDTSKWSLSTATVTTDTPSNTFARAPGKYEVLSATDVKLKAKL